MEVSTGTRVPPPSWINRDFIEAALKTAERKNFTLDSMNVQYANAEGLGFLSMMFRVTLFLRYEDNEETQKKTVIVKTNHESGQMKDLVEACDLFRYEGEMLHDVLPQIHEKLAVLEGDESQPLAAKCYQWRRQPTAFIVMEDLSPAGFRMAQAGQPLDLKHCAVALRAYARLHAASAYVLSNQPQYKESFNFHMSTHKYFKENMGSIGRMTITALANELDRCPGYEKYSERYRAFADHFVDVAEERMKQIKMQTKLSVLIHGDCWKNNFLFKYVSGEVSDVRLVDFQCSSASSPACDLTNFLYANASEEVHRHHMEDLLSQYHSSLVGLLRRLGMEKEAEAYTLQQLEKDMDHCLVLGVFFSTMSGLIRMSEENGVEYIEALTDEKKLSDALIKSIRNQLSYMKYLTSIFTGKGIL